MSDDTFIPEDENLDDTLPEGSIEELMGENVEPKAEAEPEAEAEEPAEEPAAEEPAPAAEAAEPASQPELGAPVKEVAAIVEALPDEAVGELKDLGNKATSVLSLISLDKERLDEIEDEAKARFQHVHQKLVEAVAALERFFHRG